MTRSESPDTVKVLDKEFERHIPADQIMARIQELGAQMQKDLCTRNPVFLGVLNGSFFFVSDLLKEIDFPCEVSFVKVSSYQGLKSTGQGVSLIGLDESLKGRCVVVVEDIIDTGRTMSQLLEDLKQLGAADIKVATLILKPDALKYEVPVHYAGFEVPDDFLIGYGLDYNKQGRHYKDIYKIKS